MTPERAHWGALEPRMYLQAADGSIWRVDGKRRDVGDAGWTLLITNAAGQSVEVMRGYEDPVTVMVPTMEEAENLLLAALPVNGISRRVLPVEQIRTHPDTKLVRAALAGHLEVLHGISISPSAHAENGDIEGLIEAHNISHANPASVRIPHVHTLQL